VWGGGGGWRGGGGEGESRPRIRGHAFYSAVKFQSGEY